MTEHDRLLSLLTTPPEIGEIPPITLTGNEYISLPDIGEGGTVHSINVLHMGHRGLLEFRGTENSPFLEPVLLVDGDEVDLKGGFTSGYELDWIPVFTGKAGGVCTLEGSIAAPPGRRGCCFRLKLTNRGDRPMQAALGWRGCWSSFNHVIFNRRAITAERVLAYNEWTKSLVLEARSGLPLAAAALALEPAGEWRLDSSGPGSFEGMALLELAPGESGKVLLYLAVNLEADGAATTALDLKRHEAAALFAETEKWLGERRVEFADAELAAVLNRNLFFNYFFALGRALDSDAIVPVTSRSPRYYVSAAFWSRDTLLWSFPGLLLADRYTCRELLLTVFERHLAHAGDHAHYINGVVLYPGFELDQLAAHFLALERYEEHTGDLSLVEEELMAGGLAELAAKAEERRDPETGLYSTFLDPSDDPVLYPYLVYDNALLQRGFAYLGGLQAAGRWSHGEDFTARAEALKQSILKHGVVNGPRGKMFAWAVDGRGKYQLYDNPPGSLQLLAHYGFCPPDDPVFVNTVEWIRSSANPYFHPGCRFEEAGSLHCGNPWPMAACNDLLCFNRGGFDFFRSAPMDGGFFCETVDPETGRVKTGAAFASAAGFLAYALWTSCGKGKRPNHI